MIIGYHLIWTAYGWWLPNDPRGSMSRSIASDVIAELGELHFGRKKVQPPSREIRSFYRAAEDVLDHDLLKLGQDDVTTTAQSFSATIARNRYTCYACAIMPDHVHILIRKHKHQAGEMVAHLQNDSGQLLRDKRLRPPGHPVWAASASVVNLDKPDEIWRTIRYIQQNPVKWKLPPQQWDFVIPYNNWPLHEGHSPRSPYAQTPHGQRFRPSRGS